MGVGCSNFQLVDICFLDVDSILGAAKLGFITKEGSIYCKADSLINTDGSFVFLNNFQLTFFNPSFL